jgi:hypothetical protein
LKQVSITLGTWHRPGLHEQALRQRLARRDGTLSAEAMPPDGQAHRWL